MDIISLLGAFAGIISVIIIILKLRTVDVAGVAQEFLDDYRIEIKRLKRRVDELEKKAEENKKEILKLSYELFGAWERITALESENERLFDESITLRKKVIRVVKEMTI